MNTEEIRDYCLSKQNVTEDFPFDEDTLVFRIRGKIFALLSLSEATLNLKCDPEKAVMLREEYSCVSPGYHMNKKHWNTITLTDCPGDHLVREWIDHSYSVVFESLPAKYRGG